MMKHLSEGTSLRLAALAALSLFTVSDALAGPPFFDLLTSHNSVTRISRSSFQSYEDGWLFRWVTAGEDYDNNGQYLNAGFQIGEYGYRDGTGEYQRNLYCWVGKDVIKVLYGAKVATFQATVADVDLCNNDAWNADPFTSPVTVSLTMTNPTYFDSSRRSGTGTNLTWGTVDRYTCQRAGAENYQNTVAEVNGEPWLVSEEAGANDAWTEVCNLINKSQ